MLSIASYDLPSIHQRLPHITEQRQHRRARAVLHTILLNEADVGQAGNHFRVAPP